MRADRDRERSKKRGGVWCDAPPMALPRRPRTRARPAARLQSDRERALAALVRDFRADARRYDGLARGPFRTADLVALAYKDAARRLAAVLRAGPPRKEK